MARRDPRGASSLNWLMTAVAAAAVTVSTFAFIFQTIYAYVVVYPLLGLEEPGAPQAAGFANFVGTWGARAFFLAAVILASYWVVRRVGEAPVARGMSVGVVAAGLVQVVFYLVIPPVLPFEASVYLLAGLSGGYLGGVMGRRAAAGREALYRASRRIGEARDARSVAAAIGECLAGPNVGDVVLWRPLDKARDASPGDGASPRVFAPWGSWASRRGVAWPADDRLDATGLPGLADIEGRRAVTVLAGELPVAGRETWERLGVRAAFLAPLTTRDEGLIGLLMVTLEAGSVLPRSVARDYLTVGAQATLALENMRLLEEAGRMGKEAGVLRERQRLSHEIHDTLAQGFTSIAANLNATLLRRPSAETDQTKEERGHLEQALRMAREGLGESRRLVWALRPEALERLPLHEALEELAERWSGETGTEARVNIIGDTRALTPEAEIVLLRVAQEALNNVRKHAAAGRTTLTLSYMDDRVVLDVLDDGEGFEADRVLVAGGRRPVGPDDTGGFGLGSVHERVEALGGTMFVESAPGEGCALVIGLPVDATLSRETGPDGPAEARGPTARIDRASR